MENINDFNTGIMIKEPRIVFTSTKKLRDSVVRQQKSHNGGVLEDGVNYASLTDYRKAKSITTGSGNEEEGEGPSV